MSPISMSKSMMFSSSAISCFINWTLYLSRFTVEKPNVEVLTIQSGINHPRYPSLSNVLRAKKQELEVILPGPAEEKDGNETLTKIFYPGQSAGGTFIEGSPEEKAGKLYDILNKKSLI